MNEVGIAPVSVNNQEITLPKEQPNFIVLDEVPDSFEHKTKITTGGVLLAGAGSISVGSGSYKFAKKGLDKFLTGAEKEISSFCQEIGKTFNGIPANVKASLKYGGAILAAVGSALLFFKDSDKDGKLDIIESLQKFISPNE